jgi:hypothetical protein
MVDHYIFLLRFNQSFFFFNFLLFFDNSHEFISFLFSLFSQSSFPFQELVLSCFFKFSKHCLFVLKFFSFFISCISFRFFKCPLCSQSIDFCLSILCLFLEFSKSLHFSFFFVLDSLFLSHSFFFSHRFLFVVICNLVILVSLNSFLFVLSSNCSLVRFFYFQH